MNAIISLCHFCEAHGPCSVFCTQTLRNTKIDENLFNNKDKKDCSACFSIGNYIGLLSQDDQSNANFLSSQMPVLDDTVKIVKNAATRSLSCEVSAQKDGGFVFFGDAVHGHVLSHTFQIRDAQARGFFRLFSIVIIMKDKSFLLNIKPFLAENLQNISKKLQNYGFATFTAEQSKGSERAKRLNSGHANTQAPRSLPTLTGETNIFAQLHTHFTWLLWAGARYLSETVTIGCPTVPPWIGNDTEEGFSMVQIDKEEWLLKKYKNDIDDQDTTYSLRKCKEILNSDFSSACYCALVGIQIILRGPQSKTAGTMKCLRKLLPHSFHNLTQMNSHHYIAPNDCRILSVVPEAAVPQPSANIFRIDFLENSVSVKWIGEMPNKLPDLLTKILKAVNEKLFTDFVLNKHLNLLVEEWKNKIMCIKKIKSNQEQAKIKKILGIQPQDQLLVNYWTKVL